MHEQLLLNSMIRGEYFGRLQLERTLQRANSRPMYMAFGGNRGTVSKVFERGSNHMRLTGVAAIACICFGVLESNAQEPVASNDPASEIDETSLAADSPELDTPEADDNELTRAERRELRRAERDARLLAEATGSTENASGAEDADEGVICRRESVTGSHRQVRICTTRAEREAARESARETIREIGRPAGGLGPEGN